ncbi:MAG: hypothetical protein V4671_32220 [Armatimonadota bacterium]
MGQLKSHSSDGGYTTGLYASASLMILASLLAFKTLRQKQVAEPDIAPLAPTEAVALR